MPSVNVPYRPEHEKLARDLVAETKANDGLAPVDIERFWADQEIAGADPFGDTIPQCPLGMMMSGECVYDELGLEEDFWRYGHDPEWRLELHRAYNDKSERIVGRRLLNETPPDPNAKGFPGAKGLHDIFEAKNVWHAGSWWLQQAADNEDELAALLDRVEERLDDLRGFLLPPEWDEQKDELLAAGVSPPRYRGQRGPITFAASVFGPENLIFLIHDNEQLAGRFRDLILKSMLGIAQVLDAEHGDTPETAPHGFAFCDDNCCLMTPDMYEFFGYPILKGIFDTYSPNPEDRRFQHSDSAMGHLLPLLGRLDLTGTNFGPTVMADEIRAHLPRAVISGELAPFTLSRNEEENIVLEFLRDFEMTREKRGLRFATAGSINNGSALTSMRLIMAAIQRYGRYDQ
jgi:uroporphyrinogen decarboxylase